jgi:hypothetical protein
MILINIIIIVVLIAFGLIAYESSPLIHTYINTMIDGINSFNTIAEVLTIK